MAEASNTLPDQGAVHFHGDHIGTACTVVHPNTDREAELARRREYEAKWSANCAEDCMERSECEDVGIIGHSQCGWCEQHDAPRHHCGADCIRWPAPEPTHSDPHLFLAKNAQGADVLWWGEGPDDRRCQELDLSSLRRGNRDAEKAVWEAVMGSCLVEDCTDWTPDA